MFQNLGDGTYFHSGSLAIRQAIAAKVNITYKILYNDAVAMTGGQPVDGSLTVPGITHQVRSEGVQTIIVMSDDVEKWSNPALFPDGVEFIHRDELHAVQKRLREVAGTSVLIYDQTCATEKRRRRKRGKLEDPAKRVFINSLVCEGCGDCGKESFCVSVLPKETEYGRKREIDQSGCNKDYSCIKGFCPSFVTIHGGGLKKRKVMVKVDFSTLPQPAIATDLARPWNILVRAIEQHKTARLYTSGDFTKRVRDTFDGGYKIHFHLAPPLLARRNSEGHLRKGEYGPWVFTAFKLLAKLRGVRGGAFDIFGYSAERKQERQLIEDYTKTVDELLAGLNRDNHALAVDIACIPEHIRGYGHVKQEHYAKAKARWDELMHTWRNPQEARAAA